MAIDAENVMVTIRYPKTRERSLVLGVTGYSPIIDSLCALGAHAVEWNPAPGPQAEFFASQAIECFGTWSMKAWHNLGRPRGMSHSHWRKVQRERRLGRTFDVHISADDYVGEPS